MQSKYVAMLPKLGLLACGLLACTPAKAPTPQTASIARSAPAASIAKSPPPPREPATARFVRIPAGAATFSLPNHVDRVVLARTDPKPEPDPSGSYGASMDVYGALLANAIAESGQVPEMDPKEMREHSSLPESVFQKSSAGDFLARIWSLYGPPREGRPTDEFNYGFIDRKTHIVFDAYAGGTLPKYGGAYLYDGPWPPPTSDDGSIDKYAHPNTKPEIFLEAVTAFEAMLDAAPLADCTLVDESDGPTELLRYGARGGKAFVEDLSVVDAFDFYLDWIKREGPEQPDAGPYYLAFPAQEIRGLWTHQATDADRAQRPNALPFAQDAWSRDLKRLQTGKVEWMGSRPVDTQYWELMWSALDEDARPLGLETPANRKSINAAKPKSLKGAKPGTKKRN